MNKPGFRGEAVGPRAGQGTHGMTLATTWSRQGRDPQESRGGCERSTGANLRSF